ncbi:MAG: acetyl-CoA carboxylase carboxyl transferase subunit beta [Chloroflexi bacterium]|nr:acetyl-CoA carboxylase carboxyl transferase subunit beta [Chloroflexota bacterium]
MVRGFSWLLGTLFNRSKGLGDWASVPREWCLVCGAGLAEAPLYQEIRVCPSCRFHYTITARERVALLADAGTFKEKYRRVTSLDPLSFHSKVPYRKRLFRDQKRTGLMDAAVVGRCTIGGVKAVLVLLDFSFMGGTMGCVVGEKVAMAFEYAARKRYPVVAWVSSGGARIQEGMLSLMQMAKTVAAADRFHQRGLPFFCVLASPTTGQVFASFVNLADVLMAEPGALVGFTSMRTLQRSVKDPLDQNSHTAEAHLTRGTLDLIVDREQLKATAVQLLRLLWTEGDHKVKSPKAREVKLHKLDAWQAVQRAREPGRPTATDYIQRICSDFIELHGDRTASDDPRIVWGVGNLAGRPSVIIGQRRSRDSVAAAEEQMGVPAFRKVQRALRLASTFHLPVITLVDTPGPSQGLAAEEEGLGAAIAATLTQMVEVPVPTIAAIIGEGGGEAALALSVADHILMQEGAIYSPISPEGAASIMFRDATRTEEAARSLRLTATDCQEMEIIDTVVPEPAGGAHADPQMAARLLGQALVRSLAQVQKLSPDKLLKERYNKFRHIGRYTSYVKAALQRELSGLQQAPSERSKKGRKKGQAERGVLLVMPGATVEGPKSSQDGKKEAPIGDSVPKPAERGARRTPPARK